MKVERRDLSIDSTRLDAGGVRAACVREQKRSVSVRRISRGATKPR